MGRAWIPKRPEPLLLTHPHPQQQKPHSGKWGLITDLRTCKHCSQFRVPKNLDEHHNTAKRRCSNIGHNVVATSPKGRVHRNRHGKQGGSKSHARRHPEHYARRKDGDPARSHDPRRPHSIDPVFHFLFSRWGAPKQHSCRDRSVLLSQQRCLSAAARQTLQRVTDTHSLGFCKSAKLFVADWNTPPRVQCIYLHASPNRRPRFCRSRLRYSSRLDWEPRTYWREGGGG